MFHHSPGLTKRKVFRLMPHFTCPLCGKQLYKVYDLLSSFYECEGDCFYVIGSRDLEGV